jgi:hypothetical protein
MILKLVTPRGAAGNINVTKCVQTVYLFVHLVNFEGTGRVTYGIIV